MKSEFLKEFRERAKNRAFWSEAKDMRVKLNALPEADRAEVCAELSDVRETVRTRELLAWTLPLVNATRSMQIKLLRDPTPAVRQWMTKFERKSKQADDAFVAEGLAGLDAYHAMVHDDASQWQTAALEHMLPSGDLLLAWAGATRLLDACKKGTVKWPPSLMACMQEAARANPCAGAAMSMVLYPCNASEAKTLLANIASAADIDATNFLRDLARQPHAPTMLDQANYLALTRDALGHAQSSLGFASDFGAALEEEGWKAKEPMRMAPLPPIALPVSDAAGALVARQILPIGFDASRPMPGTEIGTTYGDFLRRATSSGSLSYASLGQLLAAFYEADHERPKQVSRDWILGTLARLSKDLPAGFKASMVISNAARVVCGIVLPDAATYFDLARALTAGCSFPTAEVLAPLVALAKSEEPAAIDAQPVQRTQAQVRGLRDAAYAGVSVDAKRVTVCAWLITGLGDLLFAYKTAVALRDRFPNCQIEVCYDANNRDVFVDQLGLDTSITLRAVTLDEKFFESGVSAHAPSDLWVCAPMFYEMSLCKPKFVDALMALSEDKRLALDEYGRQSQIDWGETPHRPDMYPGFSSEDDGVFLHGSSETVGPWRRRDNLAPHAHVVGTISQPVRNALLGALTPLTYLATHALYAVYQKKTGQLALEHIARQEGARWRHLDVMLVGDYNKGELTRTALRLWPGAAVALIEPLSGEQPVALRQPLDVKKQVRMFVVPRLSREDFQHVLKLSARVTYVSGDHSFNEALGANKIAVYERFAHKTSHHQAWQNQAPAYRQTLAYDDEADRLPLDIAVPDKSMRRTLVEEGLHALATTPDLATRIGNAVARKLTLQSFQALKALDADVTADASEASLEALRLAVQNR